MAAAAPANVPDLGAGVSVSALRGGVTAIVRPQQGAPVAAVELWYRAPSTGFGLKPQPGLARLAAQAVAASKPIVGDSLGERVAAAGGRLLISVYSDSIEIAAVVPAPAAQSVVHAMTVSYFSPVLTDGGFRRAQRELANQAILAPVEDIENSLRDAVFAQLFRTGPQHYPTLGDQSSVGALQFGDVQAFATRAFRSSNANLIVSGAVTPNVAGAASGGRSDQVATAEAPAAGALAGAHAPVVRAALEPSGGFGWVGPPIASEREATAMDFIADYLFRRETGTVTGQAAQRFPKAFVTGEFITLRDPGVMFVAYGGADGSQIGDLIRAGIVSMTHPFAPSAFSAARAAFEFHLLGDLQTPQQLADNFGWYTVEGNPAYAPGAGGQQGPYFAAADSLTPEYVAAVARKFLAAAPAVVTFTPAARTGTGAL